MESVDEAPFCNCVKANFESAFRNGVYAEKPVDPLALCGSFWEGIGEITCPRDVEIARDIFSPVGAGGVSICITNPIKESPQIGRTGGNTLIFISYVYWSVASKIHVHLGLSGEANDC